MTEQRPRQVTTASVLAGAGSVLLLLSVFTQMADLDTVDTREAVVAALEEFRLDIGLGQALAWMRVGLFVVAGAAAATVVTAIFAARRDRPSRVVLTVMAGVLFICGVLVDPLLTAFIAVGAALLWSGPANDWFAGRPVRPDPVWGRDQDSPSRDSAQAPSTQAPSAQAPSAPPPSAPSSDPGPGSPADGDDDRPATWFPPRRAAGDDEPVAEDRDRTTPSTPRSDPFATRPAEPDRRVSAYVPHEARATPPAPVRAACLITAVFSGCTAALMLLAGAQALLDPGGVIESELQRDPRYERLGVSYELMQGLLVLFGIVGAAWALGAALLALFAWRGQSWARLLLLISASIAGGMALLAGFTAPPFFVVTLICVVVIWLLYSRPAGAWFRSHQRR